MTARAVFPLKPAVQMAEIGQDVLDLHMVRIMNCIWFHYFNNFKRFILRSVFLSSMWVIPCIFCTTKYFYGMCLKVSVIGCMLIQTLPPKKDQNPLSYSWIRTKCSLRLLFFKLGPIRWPVNLGWTRGNHHLLELLQLQNEYLLGHLFSHWNDSREA